MRRYFISQYLTFGSYANPTNWKIEQVEADGTKVNNYALAKQVGIEVEQPNAEEEWDFAYKRRVVSIAVSRKKKVAVDAISNVAKGVFP